MEAPALSAGRSARVTPLLEVRDLTVAFEVEGKERRVVAGVSYSLPAGRTLGVVGESGCGKSMTALALMGLVPSPGKVTGSLLFEGSELLGLPESEWRKTRGARVAMVFQEPMTSLNPVMPVGKQIAEAMVLHQAIGWGPAEERAVELLEAVGIPSPRARAIAFPHQLSGGMRQRAMIAMALACRPALLIADEPTTALDVTIQAQILDLLGELKSQFGTAIMLITHAMGVVAETAQRVVVMYAGRVVEEASVEALFARPLHPYTQGLIHSIPRIDKVAGKKLRLEAIGGMVPSLIDPPPGCRFAPRCKRAMPACTDAVPELRAVEAGHKVACILY